MKKTIIIIGIVLLFASCTSDDSKFLDSIIQDETICSCNAWVREEGMTRTVIPVELDCETNEPINLPEGYIFLGCDNDDTP
jgi:hypothetical protein